MSYDFCLVIDTGGEYPARVTEMIHPTYNYSIMFATALGHPIRDLADKQASEIIPILRTAIAKMEDNPQEFKKLNPENGWGNSAGALNNLHWLLEQCLDHPKATVQI